MVETKLKIAVACGGTGGHIFPGLATARELAARGHDVALWLAGKDIEGDAVKGWQGDVVTVPSEGFQFGLSWRSALTVLRLAKAYRLALRPMKDRRPDVLLAMGSYASFGPVMAARRLGIPYVLHEANLLPGRAVSVLERGAAAVATSFEKSSYHLKSRNIEFTGLPLRKELLDASRQPRPARTPGSPLRILVMGGSRGAKVLNETVPQAVAAAAGLGADFEVEHIAGSQDGDAVARTYQNAGVKANVHAFVQRMETIYLNVDFAICRSGAATCAELAAFGLPALLVPYPFAARDHQMGNARAMQDAGAADVVEQDALSATWLRDYLVSIAGKPERLQRMETAMGKRAQPDATVQLADLLERTGGGPR